MQGQNSTGIYNYKTTMDTTSATFDLIHILYCSIKSDRAKAIISNVDFMLLAGYPIKKVVSNLIDVFIIEAQDGFGRKHLTKANTLLKKIVKQLR